MLVQHACAGSWCSVRRFKRTIRAWLLGPAPPDAARRTERLENACRPALFLLRGKSRALLSAYPAIQ